MDLEAIAQKLQIAGLNITAQQIKTTGKWEGVKTFDNSPGSKSGRYIIGENVCSWINNKSQEKGSFVLDKARIITGFDLEKKRREYDKAERDKYFANALLAKKKYDLIKQPENAISEYLSRKQVNNYGCKIDKNGDLIIPYRSLDLKPDGTHTSYLRTLQTIKPDGTKLIEFGCEKKGNMCLIGFNKIFRQPNEYNGPILVAEGYATAASLHMATGLPTVVAIDAGNIDPVMAKITKVYSKGNYIICADNDLKTEQKIGRNPGIAAAIACQEKYDCKVAIPNFTGIKNPLELTDFNDLHVAKGLDAVANVIDNSINGLLEALRLNNGKLNFEPYQPSKTSLTNFDKFMQKFKESENTDLPQKKSIEEVYRDIPLSNVGPILAPAPQKLTNALVLEYYATIANKLVETVTKQGQAKCLGELGCVPKSLNLAYEDPAMLADIMAKLTGHEMSPSQVMPQQNSLNQSKMINGK